ARQAKGRLRKLQRLQLVGKPKGSKRGMALRFAGEVRGQRGQTMLECEDVTLRVGGRTLFEHGSLKLLHGECVGLVGRNGSGKSTLMKALAGRLPLATGAVRKAHGVQIGTFSQEVTDLPHGVTV